MSKKVEHQGDAKHSDSISRFDNLTDQVKAMMEAAGIAPAGDALSAETEPVTVKVKHLHIHIGERNHNSYLTVSGDYISGNHTCGVVPFDDFEMLDEDADEEPEDDGQDIDLKEMITFVQRKTGLRLIDILEMMSAQVAYLEEVFGGDSGCGTREREV